MRIEQYEKMAAMFGTGVGVAEWSGDFYPDVVSVSTMSDEMKVIALTNHIIEQGIYQQVHRELYRLRKKIGKRRIKESTLYEKAIDNVILNYKGIE